MRALVFESDDATRRWLEAGIRARGRTVTSCRDAEAAREACAAEDPVPPMPSPTTRRGGRTGRAALARAR